MCKKNKELELKISIIEKDCFKKEDKFVKFKENSECVYDSIRTNFINKLNNEKLIKNFADGLRVWDYLVCEMVNRIVFGSGITEK